MHVNVHYVYVSNHAILYYDAMHIKDESHNMAL